MRACEVHLQFVYALHDAEQLSSLVDVCLAAQSEAVQVTWVHGPNSAHARSVDGAACGTVDFVASGAAV